MALKVVCKIINLEFLGDTDISGMLVNSDRTLVCSALDYMTKLIH